MGNAELANRSCGTCRDRRILCDRATPSCLQCSRSKRKCKGYGLRLSWPSLGNVRRAMVVKPALQGVMAARPTSRARLVHMASWDVEMHHYLTTSSLDSSTRPILYIPTPLNPLVMEAADKDLFQYFQYTACQSLTTFGHDPTRLGEFLMRIAVASDTSSAAAVLRSLLALSSLHRHGLQQQAANFKVEGLKALAAASNEPNDKLGSQEVIQHVAAGMLLCSFEVQQSSCTSSHWVWYIAGVKEVLKSKRLRECQNEDLDNLADWVYYHDVLARFTLRHWNPEDQRPPNFWTEVSTPLLSCQTRLPKDGNFYRSMPYTLATLELLSEVCDTVTARRQDMMSVQDREDYKAFLRVLDWRIRNISNLSKANEASETTAIVELYQLAALVYLNRVSGNLLDHFSRTQQQIDKAFSIFSTLSSCERQFPVFILGCEARTDDQRTIILDLMARTEKKASSRSLLHLNILLHAVWAQDDLADRELDYWDKLSSIISSCSIVPSLV